MKKILIFMFVIALLSGCSINTSINGINFSSDREPLLKFYDDGIGNRIICRDGRVFEEKTPYSNLAYFFLGKISENQIKKIKSQFGNKTFLFNGPEYELPYDVFPEVYPKQCIIEYNGSDQKEDIDFKKCQNYTDQTNKLSFLPDFDAIDKNYKNYTDQRRFDWVKLGIKRNSITDLCKKP